MKVRIIEDEKLLADSLKTLLESKGFEVEAVYDGETGADWAETGVYDRLILDVMMPGMDGDEVARAAEALRRAHSHAHGKVRCAGPDRGPQCRGGLLSDQTL